MTSINKILTKTDKVEIGAGLVLVIGNARSGKTSFVKREFPSHSNISKKSILSLSNGESDDVSNTISILLNEWDSKNRLAHGQRQFDRPVKNLVIDEVEVTYHDVLVSARSMNRRVIIVSKTIPEDLIKFARYIVITSKIGKVLHTEQDQKILDDIIKENDFSKKLIIVNRYINAFELR